MPLQMPQQTRVAGMLGPVQQGGAGLLVGIPPVCGRRAVNLERADRLALTGYDGDLHLLGWFPEGAHAVLDPKGDVGIGEDNGAGLLDGFFDGARVTSDFVGIIGGVHGPYLRMVVRSATQEMSLRSGAGTGTGNPVVFFLTGRFSVPVQFRFFP